MGRVEAKVAVVTGGAGGMGEAIGQKLAEEGAKVVLTDLSADGEAVAERLRGAGLDVTFRVHDVTDESSWTEALQAVVQTHGRVDILVNNAGIASGKGQPFDSIALDDWRRVMRVNLDGVFIGMREAIKLMKTSGGGSIVNIGSVAGFVGTRGGAGYGTSKGALRTLTRQAAYSCAKHNYGVRVNVIHPSYVWTPLVAKKAIAEYGSKEAAMAAFAAHSALGRMNEPEDVAWAVLYLASDESRQVTGIDLVIDAGQLIL